MSEHVHEPDHSHEHDHSPANGQAHTHEHDHVDEHEHEHEHAEGTIDHGDHVHTGAEDHSHVGQGYVALDIGDGYGAAILYMPESMMHVEIETRLVGSTEPAIHVMVLPRPVNNVATPTIVFPSLPAGDYEFWIKPDGPVMLTLAVPDSGIGEATWPTS